MEPESRSTTLGAPSGSRPKEGLSLFKNSIEGNAYSEYHRVTFGTDHQARTCFGRSLPKATARFISQVSQRPDPLSIYSENLPPQSDLS